ncbi:MAG: serine/threonine-protein kinase [Myxococcota bacterium]
MTTIVRGASVEFISDRRRAGQEHRSHAENSVLFDIDRRRVKRDLKARMFGAKSEPVFVGRYELVRRLGAGAVGQVHEAVDRALERRVALKLLDPEKVSLLTKDQSVALKLEARSLARLSDPNVVQVYEVGLGREPLYIAMELIDGKNAERWRREDQPSWREIVSVFRQAGHGLEAAHRAGIVHRDFKPQNVMVGREPTGRVCVTDFGLARPVPKEATVSRLGGAPGVSTMGSADTADTRSGWAGTPPYMAPEQVDGVASPWGDQFAFCASLYHALYDCLPFTGETLDEIQAKKLAGPPMPADPRGVPRWVLKVLRRGLAVDPEQRYPSMRPLLAALDLRRRRVVRATAGGVLGASLLAAAVTSVAMLPGPRCESFANEASEIWNDEIERRSRERFVATGLPRASELHERISERMTERVEEWTALRTQACEAQLDQAEQTVPQGAAARAQCLDARRVVMEKVARGLEEADETVVRRAAASTDGLMPLDLCLEEIPVAPDLDEPLEQALAKSESLMVMGRFEQAREEVSKVLRESPTDEPRWYDAWVRIVDARAALELHDMKAAEQRLHEAALEAEKANHERLAWTSWSSLVDLVRRGDRRKELARWIEAAAAAARRLDGSAGHEQRERRLQRLRATLDLFDPDKDIKQGATPVLERLDSQLPLGDLEKISILNAQMALAIESNEVIEAQALADRLETLVDMHYLGSPPPRVDLRVGESYLDLGYAHILACRWDDAVTSFTKARRHWEDAALPEDHDYFGRLAGALAEANIGLGRLSEARQLLQGQVGGQVGLGRASALLSLGVVDFGEGKFEDARRHMAESKAIFDQQARPDYAALAGLGVAEAELHLRHVGTASALLDELGPVASKAPQAAGLLEKIEGLVALAQGREGDAVDALGAAHQNYGQCQLVEQADAQLALAEALRRQGQHTKADAAAREAAAKYSSQGRVGHRRQRFMEDLLGPLANRE